MIHVYENSKCKSFNEKISLVNGHAYAGGFLLALAHDYRVMKEDWGFMCLNEVKLGVHIPLALTTMGIEKLGWENYFEAAVIGKRFNGVQALDINLVDEIFKDREYFEKSYDYCKNIAEISSTDHEVMHLMKEDIFRSSIE